MSRRPIRCYEYVNQPYDRATSIVRSDPAALFRRAADAAGSRAEAVAGALQVEVGGIAIGTDIAIEVEGIEEPEGRAPLSRVMRLKLRWQAAKRPGMFPTMQATLSFYPLSPEETQLDFEGEYEPPLGLVGAGADAVVGHRIAEASVHRFLREIATRLAAELAG
jgi:hypothetical protein